MAQEIKLQAIPPRPMLFGLPCFRVLGVKSLTAWGPGAGGCQCSTSSNAEKKSAPAGVGRRARGGGRNGSEICRSKCQGELFAV